MTANTTNYDFPYPELSDSPDGATQMENLAVAIDTQIKSTDDTAADLATTVDGKMVTLGAQVRASTSTTSSTTELQVLSTGAVALDAASAYMIIATFLLTGITDTATEITGRIRSTSTSGTVLSECFIHGASGSGHGSGITVGIYKTTTAESSHTFVGTIQATTGDAATINQPGTTIAVVKLGASTLVGSV